MTEQGLPLFGVRKYARKLQDIISKQDGELDRLRSECSLLSGTLDRLGGLSFIELEVARKKLEDDIDTLHRKYSNMRAELSEQQGVVA